MEGDTNRMNRVLLLWLELHQAVSQAGRRGEPRPDRPRIPWESEDAAVQDVWRRLTNPDNQLVLEQWLCQSAEGLPAEWARQALRVCRERARRASSGKP